MIEFIKLVGELYSSDNDGLHGNSVEHATDAEVCVGLSDFYVALVSPRWSPWVSDNEVVKVGGLVVSPSHWLHCMVNGCRASGIVIDTWLVRSEARFRCIKWDWCGSIHQGCLESGCWALSGNGTWDTDSDLAWIISTFSVIGNVGIAWVKLESILLDISIAISKETTIAAIVTIRPWAVDKLLFS